jgi:ATP-dependent NAD(P)H-hydrate dehydratase
MHDPIRQTLSNAGVNHKGSHGKISVVGGNKDFTGAPFFSAFSAMQAGADYGNVLCTEGAATAIKSYAPELIVIPCMLQLQDITSDGVRTLRVMRVAREYHALT